MTVFHHREKKKRFFEKPSILTDVSSLNLRAKNSILKHIYVRRRRSYNMPVTDAVKEEISEAFALYDNEVSRALVSKSLSRSLLLRIIINSKIQITTGYRKGKR